MTLESITSKWLFPGLIFAMVINNQLWMLGQFYIGQMISWVNDLCAVIIVIATFRNKLWPLILVLCIVSAKTYAAAFGGTEFAYTIFLNILFCIAGAIIASQRPHIIYKQVVIICLLNLPVMFLQIVGVGTWTQFLTTHGDKLTEPVRTLFISADEFVYETIQARPAGLLHSNIFLSLVVLFGLSLHFGKKRGRFIPGALILCAVAVLSMAKVVFLGLTVIIITMLITGNHLQRRRSLEALVLVIFLLSFYAFMFPGMFKALFSLSGYTFSLFSRLNDIAETLSQGSFFLEQIQYELVGFTTRPIWLEEGEHVSGYSKLFQMLPYVIVLLPLLTIFFSLGYRKMLNRYPHLSHITILMLLVIIIMYPFVHPIWVAQIYWFMAGFALLPLFVQFLPRYFKGSFAAHKRAMLK